MPKTRQQKQEILKSLKETLDQAKSAILASFSNIAVSDQEDIRSRLRDSKTSFSVFKKTLLKKVLQEKKISIEKIDDWIGNIALATNLEDQVAPAKILTELSKSLEGLEIKAGLLEGKIIGMDQVKALASLPSKEELIAKLIGSIRSPLYGFVNVLQGNQRGLVSVLSQIRNKK
jgi:large subunit ribosomal protein L10